MTHLQTATAVALILGYFAAHAAALLTHYHAPDWVQGLVTTVLNVIAGVVATVIWNPGDSWKTYLTNVIAALVTTFLAYKTKIPAQVELRTQAVGIGKNAAGVRARHVAQPQTAAAA